jgi:hypothetical protein
MFWDKIGVGILVILFGNVAQILESSFIVDAALLWICLFHWWYNEYSQKISGTNILERQFISLYIWF